MTRRWAASAIALAIAIAACGGACGGKDDEAGKDAGPSGGSTTDDGSASAIRVSPPAGGGSVAPVGIDDLEQPDFNIVQLDDDRFVVERDGLLQLLIDGMAGLITMQHHDKGYQLSAIGDGALAHRLGVKVGDVFVSVNAIKLERKSDIRRVHTLLRTSGELHVVMERTGVSLKRRYILADTLADKLPDSKLFPARNASDYDFAEHKALMDVIASGIKRISATSVEVDKGIIIALADNPAFLGTTPVAVPEGGYRRGRSPGVYIGAERSVYTLLGFTQYDLIKKIGDRDITFSNELHIELGGQREKDAFAASLDRLGEPQTIGFKVVTGLVDKASLDKALVAWQEENSRRRPNFEDPFKSPYSTPFPTRTGRITKRSDYHEGVSATGPQKYTITKASWAKIVENPSDAALDARILPEYDDQYHFAGIKIFGVRDETLYKAAGFEDGDVVTAINGTELTTANDALAAAVKLETVREFTITFKRNGDKVTHTYTIK